MTEDTAPKFFSHPRIVDVSMGIETDQPESDFIWPGFLAGSVGALVASGAVGKSFFALEAAMAVACGEEGGNLLGLQIKKHGPVRYFANEDPARIILQRIRTCGENISSESARKSIAENLKVQIITGQRMNIVLDGDLKAIVRLCADARLVVLDTLGRAHPYHKGSYGDMAQLIGTLEYIALKTRAAILFLHNVVSGTEHKSPESKQRADSGDPLIIDHARWCGFIAGMTKEEACTWSAPARKEFRASGAAAETESHNWSYLAGEALAPVNEIERKHYIRFGVSKHNYSEAPTDRWYKRGKGGVLLPVELMKIESGSGG